MQIQLKQSEIEIALRDYITKLGINLKGRSVQIEFTSGRKENGITADLCVSDTAGDLPDFDDEQVQPTPQVSLVRSPPVVEDSAVSADSPQSLLNTSIRNAVADTQNVPSVSGTPTSLFSST